MTKIKAKNNAHNIDFERISELVSRYEQIKKSGSLFPDG